MKIRRFEDIVAWQKGRELTLLVYDLTGGKNFRRDFEQVRQMRRASASVMHNIAEGFDAGSDPEFTRFLRYARRSVSEVQSQSYLALDQGYITDVQFNDIYSRAVEIKKIVNGLIRYLSQSAASNC